MSLVIFGDVKETILEDDDEVDDAAKHMPLVYPYVLPPRSHLAGAPRAPGA